jgi:hypothetical protein
VALGESSLASKRPKDPLKPAAERFEHENVDLERKYRGALQFSGAPRPPARG